jgi:hypothetical protein
MLRQRLREASSMIHKIATLLKLDTLLGRYLRLDCERSIWVEEEELGAYRFIEHRRKRYRVKIPRQLTRESPFD